MELPLHVLCNLLGLDFKTVYPQFAEKDEALFSKLLTRAVKVVNMMKEAGLKINDPRIIVLDNSLIIEYDDCYKDLIFEANRDIVALEVYNNGVLKTLSFNPESKTSTDTFIALAKAML